MQFIYFHYGLVDKKCPNITKFAQKSDGYFLKFHKVSYGQ